MQAAWYIRYLHKIPVRFFFEYSILVYSVRTPGISFPPRECDQPFVVNSSCCASYPYQHTRYRQRQLCVHDPTTTTVATSCTAWLLVVMDDGRYVPLEYYVVWGVAQKPGMHAYIVSSSSKQQQQQGAKRRRAAAAQHTSRRSGSIRQ